MKTLFLKEKSNLKLVSKIIDPENEWVLNCSRTDQKFDGTACAIIEGELYKRYDAKAGKSAPIDAIPCQEPDEITSHHPHWVKCNRNNTSDKYHFEAYDLLPENERIDGTYELCGEKVNGNREKLIGHQLLRHGEIQFIINDYSYDGLKSFLEKHDIEGLVFHHLFDETKMCKIRKTDFNLNR